MMPDSWALHGYYVRRLFQSAPLDATPCHAVYADIGFDSLFPLFDFRYFLHASYAAVDYFRRLCC